MEHYGAGEAYLPVLEALGRLCRQPEGEQLIEVLRRVAPTWLVQLPAVLSETDHTSLQQKVAGTTRERMLREMTDALEGLSAAQPFVLVVEDLHWSDVSTIDLLAMLARRREAARLLVLGTYRPAELVVTNHLLKTIKQELATRGQGVEVPLGYLSAEEVQTYLTQRFPDSATDTTLPTFVYRRTEGHPLFMVQVADYLMQHGTQAAAPSSEAGAMEAVVPQGLRELIEVQVGRLTKAEQQVLEVGSVEGAEFTVASVVVGMQVAVDGVEECCERLAQRGQFIEERGVAEWPDGTVSGCYGFRHALYQEVLYHRIGRGRRARLHRALGLRAEAGYGERVSEVAAALAMHFERGQDTDRTVLYLHQAGENALRRRAYQEALEHFQRGAEFLRTVPATPDRARRELALQFLLIQAVAAVKGHASADTERAYTHAWILCEQVGNARQLCGVLMGLARIYHGHGEYRKAREVSTQCLALVQREQDPALFLGAYYVVGVCELYLGDFSSAWEHLAQGVAYDQEEYNALYISLYGANPRVACHLYAAMTLWVLGYPDQAWQRREHMVALAREFTDPLPAVSVRGLAPLVSHCFRRGAAVQEEAEGAIALATRLGFPLWWAFGTFWRGWSLVMQERYDEGIAQMRQGLAAEWETGSSVNKVHYLVLLGEACGKAGRTEEGLQLLADAQAEMDRTAERLYEAELWRITGELILQSGARRPAPQVKTGPKSKGQSPKSQKPTPNP